VWQSIRYFSALAVESLFGVFGIRLYEEPHYGVIDRIGDSVEIRHYAPRLAAEVDLTLPGETGRSEAFKLLFAYISGTNRASAPGNDRINMTVPVEVSGKQRVAMTVPVQTAEANGALQMRFFLPEKYGREDAPRPLDPRIRLVTIAGETIAILRFSGSGHDFTERQTELIARLVGCKWQQNGAPYTLNYDAPFTLPFLRRNEVAVAVVEAR
jgi:SOUL heme-binding protein